MPSAMINRVVRIISYLSAGNKVTLRELKEMVESRSDDVKAVSIRQYQRDIEIITLAGVPIIRDDNDDTYQLSRRSRLILPSAAEQNQLLAKYFLKSALPALGSSAAIESAADLTKLLEEEAPGEVLPPPDLMESINLGHFTLPANDVILANAIDVIANKQWIRMEYRGKVRKDPMFPCKLVPYNGRLYMIIWDPKYRDYAVYALDLISRITRVRDQTGLPAHVFSLKTFMATRFGLWEAIDRTSREIVLRIVKPELIYLFRNKYWHPTQTFETDAEGALLIRFTAGISPELVSLVLHWAPDIDVVKPASLRQDVITKAKQLVAMLEE